MVTNLVLLILMITAGLWTVMTRTLLKSAVGLAVVSAVLTMIMFRMDAAIAGVFELSVCAGLITVVFISTISLTKTRTAEERDEAAKKRFTIFRFLPLLVIVVAFIAVYLIKGSFVNDVVMISKPITEDFRNILWDSRRLDLLGQIVIILTGIFGIIVLLKEKNKNG